MRIPTEGGCGRKGTALILAALTLWSASIGSALFARGEKTVFTSQTLEWDPQFRKDSKIPPITFAPAWTFSGFTAPLMGDPVVVSDRLVAVSRDGDISALASSSGEVLWSARLPAPPASGLSAQGDALYLGLQDGHLMALRAADGGAIWVASLTSPVLFPPRPLEDRLLVATADANLLSLARDTGTIQARRALPGRATTTPEPAPGGLMIGTEHGMLLLLRLGDLSVRWRRYVGHAITAPPLFYRKRVYVASADRSLRCLRARSGRLLWSVNTGATCTIRPFALGPWLYLLSYDNDIYVLRAKNGHLMTRVRLGHRLEGEPARTAEHLFVAPFTEASLVGLSLPGLATAGSYGLQIPGEWFTTSPVLLGRRLAIGYGRTEGRILALDVEEKAPETKPDSPRTP